MTITVSMKAMYRWLFAGDGNIMIPIENDLLSERVRVCCALAAPSSAGNDDQQLKYIPLTLALCCRVVSADSCHHSTALLWSLIPVRHYMLENWICVCSEILVYPSLAPHSVGINHSMLLSREHPIPG